MRFPVVLVCALVCGACFSYGRTREVTSGVNATRSVEELQTCAVEQLNSLGYTITDSGTAPGVVQAVRPWAVEPDQTRFIGFVDRIDLVARNTTDRVVAGRPQTSLSATVRTLNGERRAQEPSDQVQADASRVLSTCAPQ
jgi:hypothetical protein